MFKSSISENNLVEPLKIAIFGPTLPKKGICVSHTYNEKHFFFSEITKANYNISEKFYFIRTSHVLAES